MIEVNSSNSLQENESSTEFATVGYKETILQTKPDDSKCVVESIKHFMNVYKEAIFV